MPSPSDEHFMNRALELAAKPGLITLPNPQVGAVIVQAGRVVGEGCHPGAGHPHAEVYALRGAGAQAKGATLYVTLEPCTHQGRTPPCTDAVIEAGITRVVAAMEDPDPRVRGRGCAALQAAGIEVQVGVGRSQAERLNEVYMHHRRSGRPFVLLKAAMTLDGRTATHTGDSQWISCEASRERVHHLRGRFPAVLTASGTVQADDPRLSARPENGVGQQPLRVILDSRGTTPASARCLPAHGEPEQATLVCTTSAAPVGWIRLMESQGAEVQVLASEQGLVALDAVFDLLGDRNIAGVLVEAGPTLSGALLRGGWIHKVLLFIAPRFMGGNQGVPGLFAGPGPERLDQAYHLQEMACEVSGNDLAITGYPARNGGRELQP